MRKLFSILEKIQETRVIAPYSLSYVSLALLLVNVTEFSCVRGMLIPYVQKLSILVTLKTFQPNLKKH